MCAPALQKESHASEAASASASASASVSASAASAAAAPSVAMHPNADAAAFSPHPPSKADALLSHPISSSPPVLEHITSAEQKLPARLSTLNVRAMGFTPLVSSRGSSSSQAPHSANTASDPTAGSDSEPLTPVAVREALAAMHSLSFAAGALGFEHNAGPCALGDYKASPQSPITVLVGSPTAGADADHGTKLSAAAKEWVPPSFGALATTSPAPAVDAAPGGGEQWLPGAWAPDGEGYTGEEYDYSNWQEYDPAMDCSAQYTMAVEQWGAADMDAATAAAAGPHQGGHTPESQGYDAEEFFEISAYNYHVAAAYYSLKETEDAATSVLTMAFPSYSAASLRKVLRKVNLDIAAAAVELSQLEIEHAAQQNASLTARKPKAGGPPAPVLNESNFPTLGAAPPAAATAAAAPSWAGSLQVKESVLAVAGLEDGAAAAQGGARAAALSLKHGAEGSAGRRGALRSAAAAAAAVPWVPTGEAVSKQYSAEREEARNHARVRNAYFQQATQAFLAGNKALAKQLGSRGRAANDAMKQAHTAAAERIFLQRNSGAGRQGGGLQSHNGELMIDLHGQHAAEGVAVLRRELARLRALGSSNSAGGAVPRSVYVCVGTGSHTKGANTPARLPAAVESYLSAEGISYSERQQGLLHIRL